MIPRVIKSFRRNIHRFPSDSLISSRFYAFEFYLKINAIKPSMTNENYVTKQTNSSIILQLLLPPNSTNLINTTKFHSKSQVRRNTQSSLVYFNRKIILHPIITIQRIFVIKTIPYGGTNVSSCVFIKNKFIGC